MSSLIVMLIVIPSFSYLLRRLNKLETQSVEIKKNVDDLNKFTNELIKVSESKPENVSKNISEYLSMKHRHLIQDLYIFIYSAEQLAQIDQPALKKEQEQEIKELLSKKKDKYVPSFPTKTGAKK